MKHGIHWQFRAACGRERSEFTKRCGSCRERLSEQKRLVLKALNWRESCDDKYPTARSRSGCNPRVPRAASLSLGPPALRLRTHGQRLIGDGLLVSRDRLEACPTVLFRPGV